MVFLFCQDKVNYIGLLRLAFMKFRTLILFFSYFLFSAFFSLFSVEKSGFRKAFLLNPNGLVLFKTKTQTKKIQVGVIDYAQEVSLYFDEEDSNWIEIRKPALSGFIPKNDILEKDFLIFKEPNSKTYAITKKDKILFYEKPFTEIKPSSELSQFQLVEVVGESDLSENLQDYKWFEIKISNGKKGFVKGDIDFYNSLFDAELAIKNRQINLNGYALVKNPIYISKKAGGQNEVFVEKKGSSKKGEFIFVAQSKEIEGVRYFKAVMENPSRHYKMQATPKEYNDSPFEAWIAHENVKFYSPEEFSKYTIENSKYKNDRSIMLEIAEQNKNIYLNFSGMSVNALTFNKSKKKSDFYLVKLLEGYTNSHGYGNVRQITFVVQEQKENYKAFLGSIEDRGMVEMLDLDEDGIPEFYTHMNLNSMARVAYTTPLFYAFVNGYYREIPLPGNFLDNYTIKENILYLDARDDSNTKIVKLKYKYKNGKFIQVK